MTMKKLIISAMIFAAVGCKVPDEEIRADIAGKARDNMNFAGLSYIVRNGVIDVSGSCPSKKAYDNVHNLLKTINVARALRFNVNIAPVVLDTLTPTKLKVDSVLSAYPRVVAFVSPNGILLSGDVKDTDQRQKLLTELNKQVSLPVSDSLVSY
jgi:hypothetical protein